MAGENPQTTLPPVPREPIINARGGMSQQWERWIQQLQRVLSFAGGVAWGIINKAGSKLSDIETRTHAMLTDVLGWTTGTDTAQVKHISNADGKVWQDHVEVIDGNPHGTDHDMLEAIGVLDPSDTDGVKDKHLSNGQAKVWQDHTADVTIHHTLEDIQDNIASMLTAGNAVTLTYDDVANTLTVSVAQTAAHANSTAIDVPGIVTDFNALLAKLRTSGILAT